jgi:histidyl-tRNA synthetase
LQPYANSYASEVDSYRSQPHANSYAWEVDSYRSQHHANSYAPEAESCALEVESYALEVVQHLLEKNFTTIYRFHDKLIKTFNYAQKTSCQYVLIIGLEEWKNKNVIIKNQKTKEQQVVHFDDIVKYLRKKTQNNSVKQTSDIKSPSKI